MVCILEYYKYPACMANIVNIMNIMYVSIYAVDITKNMLQVKP